MSLKRIIIGLSLLLLLTFAACSSGSSSSTSPSSSTTGNTGGSQKVAAQTPVASTPTTAPGSSKTGNGPIIIGTTTPVPGGSAHSQQLVLQDRTLIINDVKKQAGTDANSVGISVDITIKNTSNAAIKNLNSFFQLVGSEGDVFGLQSKVTTGFYGSLDAHSTRTGTIIFQVPSGAAQQLRMLYRSEIAAETAFLPLNV